MISSSSSHTCTQTHTHTHTHTHTRILCPSVLFYSLFYFSVFTFQLSRDTYYSYHPPFYINYHIVSPFISLLSLSFLQGQHAGRTAFFSSKTTFYQFAVLQHVPLSSLSGVIKPVRGTWRRLHWACRCISRGLDALPLVASCWVVLHCQTLFQETCEERVYVRWPITAFHCTSGAKTESKQHMIWCVN